MTWAFCSAWASSSLHPVTKVDDDVPGATLDEFLHLFCAFHVPQRDVVAWRVCGEQSKGGLVEVGVAGKPNAFFYGVVPGTDDYERFRLRGCGPGFRRRSWVLLPQLETDWPRGRATLRRVPPRTERVREIARPRRRLMRLLKNPRTSRVSYLGRISVEGRRSIP